jgi:hypothetical protein
MNNPINSFIKYFLYEEFPAPYLPEMDILTQDFLAFIIKKAGI